MEEKYEIGELGRLGVDLRFGRKSLVRRFGGDVWLDFWVGGVKCSLIFYGDGYKSLLEGGDVVVPSAVDVMRGLKKPRVYGGGKKDK